MDFETPPGSRPTLNSYLLWMAKTRNLAAANLWVPVPFYLMSNDDPDSHKKALEFLDNRLDLNLNFDGHRCQYQTTKRKTRTFKNRHRKSMDISGSWKTISPFPKKSTRILIKAVDDCLRKRNIRFFSRVNVSTILLAHDIGEV